MYLAVFDDNRKTSLEQKIAAGAAAYAARFGVAPAVVLVREVPAGLEAVGGVRVVASPLPRPNVFYFGMEVA
jgi:hypothetical protein